jgi:DNA methylase
MTNTIEASQKLLEAIHSTAPSKGLTHTFYRYPARFSPEFARSAIQEFSQPGDLIFDPFMGSGTALVEAMVAGRHSIGSDISSLAHFISKVKTTVLLKSEVVNIQKWAASTVCRINLRSDTSGNSENSGNYSRYLPWPIRKSIELILEAIQELKNPKQMNFARCALLRTAQWALDCTTNFPTAASFRSKFVEVLEAQLIGIGELDQALRERSSKPIALCFNVEASELSFDLWKYKLDTKPSLVLTSPPYPSVHVLYHRWQIKGRKETAAPFWIAGTYDGEGESYYTMGGRSESGEKKYFNIIERSFGAVHRLLAKDAYVVQLIAFSDVTSQLPKYLIAMENAGYYEVEIDLPSSDSDRRVWRQVPLRKWYATMKGHTSSSRELLLVHKRVN